MVDQKILCAFDLLVCGLIYIMDSVYQHIRLPSILVFLTLGLQLGLYFPNLATYHFCACIYELAGEDI